jgi:DNA uptake protein ComE-like DNA-binding protein
MRMHGAAGGVIAMLAVALALLVQGSPAGAQAGKGLIDPNTAAETDLQALPAMTPAIVKGIMERRPFKSVVELNKVLLDQKVAPEQAREFYRKAFVPINLNTGTRDEFMLIPGVGSRMSAEFMEYRPWKNWTQFDKEIGKYVGQAETDRFKQYVFIPPS